MLSYLSTEFSVPWSSLSAPTYPHPVTRWWCFLFKLYVKLYAITGVPTCSPPLTSKLLTAHFHSTGMIMARGSPVKRWSLLYCESSTLHLGKCHFWVTIFPPEKYGIEIWAKLSLWFLQHDRTMTLIYLPNKVAQVHAQLSLLRPCRPSSSLKVGRASNTVLYALQSAVSGSLLLHQPGTNGWKQSSAFIFWSMSKCLTCSWISS